MALVVSGCGADPMRLADSGAPEGGADGSTDASVAVATVSRATSSRYEGEVEVASSGATIVAAWIADLRAAPYVGIGCAVSHDDGATFGPVQILVAPGGRSAGDPSVTVDQGGDFYVSFLGLRFDSATSLITDGGVWGARLAAGGATFGDVFQISDPTDAVFYDKSDIAVTASGALIAPYAKAPDSTGNTPSSIVLGRSVDHGATWSQVVAAPATTGQFFTSPVACPLRSAGGRAYLVYWGATGASVGIFLVTSDDDGATWSAPALVSDPADAVGGVRPNCASSGDDLWVQYGATHAASAARDTIDLDDGIPVAHSTDRGRTFGQRFDAFDPMSSTYAINPRMVVDERGGVHVGYYAGNAAGDTSASFGWTHLAGGAFSRYAPLVAPVTFVDGRLMPDWLGDYVGGWPDGSRVLFAFGDNHAGASHVVVVSAPIP